MRSPVLLLALSLSTMAAPPAAPYAIDDAKEPTALVAVGLREEVYGDALRAWKRATERKKTSSSILTVIDYSRPSDERRMWVVDLAAERLLFHEYVSHGKNSGWGGMTSWSNVAESRQSSIGVSLTAETYYGKHGLSLRMDGLEKGYNERNRERDIVIHGAKYVGATFAREHGRVGNSWGCPAVDVAVSKEMIQRMKEGTVLVAWYPDARWRRESVYVKP